LIRSRAPCCFCKQTPTLTR